jgi:DNA mismatch repair ATPase MutL
MPVVRSEVSFAIWHEGKIVEQWRINQVKLARTRLADVLGDDFVRGPSTSISDRVPCMCAAVQGRPMQHVHAPTNSLLM